MTTSELKALTEALATSEGKISTFTEFREAARKIDQRYNITYLRTEYDTAISSAQMAAHWARFGQGKTDPMLRYVTAGDERVRHSHAELNGLQRPMSDPIWDMIYPPNGWNCRCTVVEVNGKPTPPGELRLPGDVPPLFQTNLAKTGMLFPKGHPYYKGLPDTLIAKAEKMAVEAENLPTVFADFDVKSVKEAEELFRKEFNINCSFKGFKKADLWQVKEIYTSTAYHFAKYPRLREVMSFIGSASGRVDMLAEKLFEDYKQRYPWYKDKDLTSIAKKHAKKHAGISKYSYAYSHGAFRNYGLDGIAVNSSEAFRGDDVIAGIKRDVAQKFHPVFCDSYKSVIDHEFGHRLDALLGARDGLQNYFDDLRKKDRSYIGENLARYGETQLGEFVAEGWSEYVNNPTPRGIAQKIGSYIVELYKANR